MAESTHAASTPKKAPPRLTDIRHTTRRGFATASFSLGFWGTCVFWWYPFGLLLCAIGLLVGLIASVLGIRAGKDGENIALLGIIFSTVGLGLSLAVYRGVQYVFEGSLTGMFFDR